DAEVGVVRQQRQPRGRVLTRNDPAVRPDAVPLAQQVRDGGQGGCRAGESLVGEQRGVGGRALRSGRGGRVVRGVGAGLRLLGRLELGVGGQQLRRGEDRQVPLGRV